MAHHRPPGCLDLPACYPGWFQRLQAKITERDRIPTRRLTLHPASELLAVLDPFWHQHDFTSLALS
jgi:hypothetical protein